MRESLDDRAHRAESVTKIFNNKVKGILFLLALGGLGKTLWEQVSR